MALGPDDPPQAEVIAIDLDTRGRGLPSARQRTRAAFGRPAARRAAILFKKIDSTLRGYVVEELVAARAALGLRRPVVLAPAFPAQLRVVKNGRLLVRGKPVAVPVCAALAEAGFELLDASTDEELDRIARRGLAMRPRPLFAGSAGLARAIARQLPRRAARGVRAAQRPILTVVGSASPVSTRQARRLERAGAAAEGHLLLRANPPPRGVALSPRHASRLARLVARVLPDAHYVLTGGETARAALRALRIDQYRLLGEVEPGVPYGLAASGALICTKAGAFGDRDTLVRCVARLRRTMSGA